MENKITPEMREIFKTLAGKYKLTKEHFHTHKHYVIIKRIGIEKIKHEAKIHVRLELPYVTNDTAVVKAVGDMNGTICETYGSATPKNCQNSYFVEMAEKRALSRVVLKLTQFGEIANVLSEDETIIDHGS